MALGEILKQKRLERNFTKEYIAERTHMMAATIEALENEDFKKIPAAIYGRGFIKTYCKVLDINPQPLIDEYMTHVDQNYARLKPVPPPPQRKLRPIEAPVRTGQRTVHPPQQGEVAKAPRLVAAGDSQLRAVAAPARPQVEPTVIARPTPPPAPVAPRPAPPPAPTPPTPPVEDDTFTLEGDVIPPPSPAPVREQRSTFVPELEENNKFHRLVSAKEARAAREEHLQPSPLTEEDHRPDTSIFGPHRPATMPTRPIIKLLQVFWTTLKNGCTSTKKRISAIKANPKIRRIDADEEAPLLSRQHLIRIATIFGVLVSLTLIFLLFRWVFKESSDYVAPTTALVEELPILTPPPPFFL